MLVLRPLFVFLPTPKDTDQESLIEGYFIALDGLSLQALQNVVLKIVKGTIGHDVKFCPRPPELASMVRKEDYILDLIHSPKQSHTPVKNPTMVSLMQKRWEGKRALQTGIDMDKYKGREWPVGSVYVPILSTVFAAGEMKYTK